MYTLPLFCVPTFFQRHVESLQTTVKRLEAELLGGQRREEALHAAAKVLREKVAASKLEAWRLQVDRLIIQLAPAIKVRIRKSIACPKRQSFAFFVILQRLPLFSIVPYIEILAPCQEQLDKICEVGFLFISYMSVGHLRAARNSCRERDKKQETVICSPGLRDDDQNKRTTLFSENMSLNIK